MSKVEEFPVDLSKFKKLTLDPSKKTLTEQEKSDLLANIQLLRDAIVVFTATGAARGVGGHTGGAYDTVPEVCILLGLFNHSDTYHPVIFDEAGHRVATQYMLSALEGSLLPQQLLFYRAANSKLPGHPELGLTPGVKFSSGRLGHMWPFVNGVSMAHPDRTIFCLGSDGSQQEGNDAEAARIAVARNLNVKLLIDDNNVTIAGHPSDYLKGFDLAKTLSGQGLKTVTVQGENIDELWGGVVEILSYNGPAAIISKRPMAPGIAGIEGSPHGHDVVSVKGAVGYLQSRGYPKSATDMLENIRPAPQPYPYVGSTRETVACRSEFGEAVVKVLSGMEESERKRRVMVIDSDLEGSTGLRVIHQKHPEVFIPSGIMERGNFSAAAGFGFDQDKQAIFSTFSAFLEMLISEITMARLNGANVLSHFSHSGVDEMCDNTCHFGVNSFFADNGLLDTHTHMYFPADALQMHAIISKIFFDKGLRFVFSTRSKTPFILKEGTQEKFFDPENGYVFTPGKDDIIVEAGKGKEGQEVGYIVSYGDMLYRAYDAVLRLRQEGLMVGLINKSTLNMVDEQSIIKMGQSAFVLVVESMSQKTGLGSKMGTWLLERHHTPRYGYIGTNKEGCGGMWEQIPHQGLDPQSIIVKVQQLTQ